MTMQAVEPRAWVDPAPHLPVPFWEGVRQDVLAHIPPDQRGRSRLGWALTALAITLRSSGFHVTLLYRLAHALRYRAGLPGRAMAGFLFWWMRHGYSCAIAPTARLHGGLILPHPQGIVIGPGVSVGPRAWIFQNATLGGAPGKVGMPNVGIDVRIYTGAVLSGPITVGDNVMIGANAVVYRDVPDRTVVRCLPVELAPLPSQFLHEDEEEVAE
jgi:serine O-acetyltransferase